MSPQPPVSPGACSSTASTERSCMLPESPASSGGSHEQPDSELAVTREPASSSTSQPKRKVIEKMPLPKFVIGGYLARNLLPASVLPRQLNPVYLEYDHVDDIPLAWYGIEWNGTVLVNYAKKYGWAVLSQQSKLGAYDIVPTWDRLRRHYYAKHGILMRIQDVWGEDMDQIEKIVSFYNNREMPGWTKEQRYVVFDTLTEMGYKPGEAAWFLDGREHL
ncbi:hypothetical protein OH76DRAFT_1412485 [Lentinus brumalis]|uniref:Uncharacterized protein n=1 Tax=Lentinus brumalis TaxID=2498619 RepID=A0A371CL66_9APHY|nr:hypothetical protein OH76DRAFT_1412485 [Polyporus brumalis]